MSMSLYEQEEWKVVHSPTSATIINIENEFRDLFNETGPFPENIEMDLKDCKFVEVTSLLWLISLLNHRKSDSLKTRIRLPQYKKVRDFMRIWDFHEAVRKTTGKPFSSWVPQSDLTYFGENKKAADLYYSGRLIDDGLNRLLSDRFFAFIVFSTEEFHSKKRTAVGESMRFETRLVKSVLSKQLKGPAGYVASRIVFESLTNAIRHPDSQHIVMASMVDGLKGFIPKSKSKESFTITVWDDGRSMIHTLRDALSAGKEIRSGTFSSLYSNYRVIIEESDGKQCQGKLWRSDFTPTIETEDEILFLSTTFPGITRDVNGSLREIYPGLSNEIQQTNSNPGMGLPVLLNTVIDVFSGELAFRTDKYFMNIRKADLGDREAQYRVKIRKYPSNCPPFLGNMLTIRLPINMEDESEEGIRSTIQTRMYNS